MSELKKAMKENMPIIKAKKTSVKKRYTGKQPSDNYTSTVKKYESLYKKAFAGNDNWDRYFKEN